MNLTIHRGTHEIGGSCVELESDGSRIVIDLGMPLVNSDGSRFNINDYADIPENELTNNILPDINGLYAFDKIIKPIDGLLISHPHADHYGFYNYVSQKVPVYIGEATNELIRITKLFGHQKHGLGKVVLDTHLFRKNKSFSCGCFTITPYIMDHSAFDSYAFLIESEGKKMIYSGDFRHHGRKKYALPRFINKETTGADALMLEGTMMGRDFGRLLTEDDITDRTVEMSKNCKGLTFMYFSSQNIDRLVSFYKAALSMKKVLVIDVYTAYILVKLKKFGKIPYPSKSYRNIRIFFGGRYLDKLPDKEKEQFMHDMGAFKISRDEIMDNPRNIMMIIRGSLLNSLKKFSYPEGSIFIYSMWEGYLKDKSMEKMMEFLNDNQIQRYILHTSGHATIDTLKYVVESIKPKALIPIHTFRPDQYNILGHHNIIRLEDGESLNI
ncbi:MAG TPA: MBL fold metallo-hydrolase [Spirochaetota bacterium]|nr:MBL fold metallo-hydrolase [Spirochaetota bacterium]